MRLADCLHRALDAVSGTPAWALSPGEQAEALVSLTRAANRFAELQLRVLAAADRNEVGTEQGATSTAAWLAHATASTTQAVLADLHLARALEEEFEFTRRALAVGDIDVAKARVVVRAVQALTEEHDDLPGGNSDAGGAAPGRPRPEVRRAGVAAAREAAVRGGLPGGGRCSRGPQAGRGGGTCSPAELPEPA
jgi:hypothetical protein